MGTLGSAISLAWNIVALFFIASVVTAPFFLLIRTLRARGRRKFAEEPAARVDALKADTTNDHIWDA